MFELWCSFLHWYCSYVTPVTDDCSYVTLVTYVGSNVTHVTDDGSDVTFVTDDGSYVTPVTDYGLYVTPVLKKGWGQAERQYSPSKQLIQPAWPQKRFCWQKLIRDNHINW